MPDVKPQLYADNLKCGAERPRALFESARFTAQYVRSVGQDVSPGKCVLLSTSKSVRKAMKLWDVSGDVVFLESSAGCQGSGVGIVISLLELGLARFLRGFVKLLWGLLQLVLYLWVFRLSWGLVRGKYLPAGLHAAKASYVSSSSISAFRAAIVRAVWSSRMPLR